MENWIGVAVWIVMGGVIGLAMKVVVKRPDTTPGHSRLLFVLGAFAAVIGGMLGVGILEFDHPGCPESRWHGGGGGPVGSADMGLPMGDQGPHLSHHARSG